ncbi:hypothetical protein Tco_1532792 [Tanacetum coccineum]
MVDFLAEVDTPATVTTGKKSIMLAKPRGHDKETWTLHTDGAYHGQVHGRFVSEFRQDTILCKKGFQLERLAQGLEVGLIRCIQGIGYGILKFLGVRTTFDIFQNIHILYLQYNVLTSFGYGVLIFFPLWSLVSAGTDTPYLP